MSPDFPEPTWLEEAMLKYKQKLNHVRLRPIFSALMMTVPDKTAITEAQRQRLDDKIKAILEAETVLPDFRIPYYAYSRALDKSQRTMEFMVDRIREHQILRERWETRGLDPAILDKLDAVLIFAL
jgi:hypothetical protein